MSEPLCVRETAETAKALFSLGQSEAQAIASALSASRRLKFAQGLCASVLGQVWQSRITAPQCGWEIRVGPVAPLDRFQSLTQRLSEALQVLSGPRIGFLVGQLYTDLLPPGIRKSLGAYYTPPPLVDRLIELISSSGFDWAKGRIIDPACGGAAFLASVAPKLMETNANKSPLAILEDIEARLVGVEVDVFAAWMSAVLLDMALLDLSLAAGRPVKNLVISCNAFDIPLNEFGQFDLVIGNPPYGRVSLPPQMRKRFCNSLFGHANLYGLFTDLAVRLAKSGGIIAFVTPTSFLGGEYFKNLRRLLGKQAPLRKADFISDRDGVFAGVLQEIMLAVFAGPTQGRVPVVSLSRLRPGGAVERVAVETIGQTTIDVAGGKPWLLPRTPDQLSLARRLNSMRHRLVDYGFAVSTGQLVWNRLKDQLRSEYGPDCHPIIWAEAVGPDGSFQFQARRRSHLPYLKVRAHQNFLLNHEPCILVQRTTAKEQKRRLVAAVIPNSFIVEYPGFVIENHLNMIYRKGAKPQIALRTLAALLNSGVVDEAFRCINGSVAVSAYELNSLPLPGPEQMQALQDLVFSEADGSEIEHQIAKFYSSPDADTPSATYSRPSRHRKIVA